MRGVTTPPMRIILLGNAGAGKSTMARRHREDEYGLKRHRKLFDTFAGSKKEYNSLDSYEAG
jgi:adenylate kinase family enzyme